MMKNLVINKRLRPIRFGFLVRPNDKLNLLKIFRVNTCLWGGQYNPIIPFFNRVPNWWSDHNQIYSAQQIINGYLDYFEPDILVESEPGMAKQYGYDKNRIISVNEILQSNEPKYLEGYGQSVNDIYRYLYQKEFRFQQKNEPTSWLFKNTKKHTSLFLACLCGDFPDEPKYQYFKENFQYVFSPEIKEFDVENLINYYSQRIITPLNIANTTLDVNYNHDNSPFLYVFDLLQSRDLLDYWNLRSVCQNTLAIPKQWLPKAEQFCKRFIEQNYRPLPGNPNGVMIRPTVMFSRSIEIDKAEALHKQYLHIEKKDINTVQYWYPSLWSDSPKAMIRRTRAILSAAEKREECPINSENENKMVYFNGLSPEFSERYNLSSCKFRWANILQMDSSRINEDIATVFPSLYRNSAYIKFHYNLANPIFYNKEGLTVFPKWSGSLNYLNLFSNYEVVRFWFKSMNIIDVSMSASGKATTQIIKTLGGFINLWSISSKDVIELLNSISQSDTKTMPVKEFRNRINKASSHIAGSLHKNRNFEMLVDKKAIELGVELHCHTCDNWGWHQIEKLNTVLTCNFCFKPLPFPVCYPDNKEYLKWSYRVVGPFSLNHYAKGGYATALSLKFFNSLSDLSFENNMTWTAGVKLQLEKKKDIEVDFLIWYQVKDNLRLNYEAKFVFGEAKSYGYNEDAFTKKDIDRMRELAERFPGSYLVFSTFKDTLSKDEKFLLGKLAKWGRAFIGDGNDTMKAYTVILTGTELFAESNILSMIWEKKGGKHKELASMLRSDDLEVFADVTQQLYLNLPPVFDDIRAKFEKKHLNRKLRKKK